MWETNKRCFHARIKRGSRGPDPPLWKMKIFKIYIVKLTQIFLKTPTPPPGQTQLSFRLPWKNFLDPHMVFVLKILIFKYFVLL